MTQRPDTKRARRSPAAVAASSASSVPSSRPVASFLSWPSGGGVRVDVAVVPNAKRTEAIGLHDGALRVRLSAPPVDGAANEALRRWLADALDVPLRAVALVLGQTSRRKRLQVQADEAAVGRWLQALQEAGVLQAGDRPLPDGS